MRALVLLAVLVAAVLAYIAVTRGMRRLAARRAARLPWRPNLSQVGNTTIVEIAKPGAQPYVIGEVPIHVPHWQHQERLAELMLEAEEKAEDLNGART